MELNKLYWLAGILEAEGSFIAPPPSAPNRPVISISMTDEDVIARIANFLSIKYHTWHPPNTEYKTAYLLRLRGYRGAVLMRELYPLMSNRRQRQIDRALEKYVEKPSQKGQNQSHSKLKDVEVREIKKRLSAGETQSSIATAFNISKRAISDIKRGKTWSHISTQDNE